MTDMAQADRTLRQRTSTTYDWTRVIPAKNFNRGDLCVIRQANGKPEALLIQPQWAYKEWVGCFSWLS